jgi:hypothetical protein
VVIQAIQKKFQQKQMAFGDFLYIFLIPYIFLVTSMISLLSQNGGLGSKVPWRVNKAGLLEAF